MSKPGSPPPEDDRASANDSREQSPDETATASGVSVKRSAMRLPEGVGPASAGRRPAPRKPWERFHGGQPQQDFARRAGKDRKVH